MPSHSQRAKVIGVWTETKQLLKLIAGEMWVNTWLIFAVFFTLLMCLLLCPLMFLFLFFLTWFCSNEENILKVTFLRILYWLVSILGSGRNSSIGKQKDKNGVKTRCLSLPTSDLQWAKCWLQVPEQMFSLFFHFPPFIMDPWEIFVLIYIKIWVSFQSYLFYKYLQ